MPVEFDDPNHCEAFVRLNEQWIKEHFTLEEADRQPAADPYRIVREGVAALRRAREDGARRVFLLTNTVLAPAIALYRKHRFETLVEGPHPVYARCNIVMELRLAPSD